MAKARPVGQIWLALSILTLGLSACPAPVQQPLTPATSPSAIPSMQLPAAANTAPPVAPQQSASPATPNSSPPPDNSSTAVPYAGPPEVLALSRKEGTPGQEVILTGRGLLQIRRILMGGQPVELLNQTDAALTLRIPSLSDGQKLLEIFGPDGKLPDLSFTIRGGSAAGGGGGGGGGYKYIVPMNDGHNTLFVSALQRGNDNQPRMTTSRYFAKPAF